MSKINTYKHGELLRTYLNDTILKKSYLSEGNIKDKELVDITNNYGWSAKILNGSIKDKQELGENQFTHQIPFAMAFERKQVINSTIRNIVQSLKIGHDLLTVANELGNFSGAVESLISPSVETPKKQQVVVDMRINNQSGQIEYNTEDAEKEAPAKLSSTASDEDRLSYAKGCITDLLNYIKEKYENVGAPDQDFVTKFLYPYAYMYMTSPTGFQYAFPMLTSGSDYFSLTNQWSGGRTNNAEGSGGTTDLINNIVTNLVTNWVDTGANIATDILNVLDAVRGSTRTVQDFYIEKAKFYNYPTEGQKVKVQFVLYNTIQKDIWKKHYKFLYLFALRNLPFKLTPFSYSPPLLYDIFLPGSKYLPLCYVSNFNVINHGVTRRLSTDAILNTGGTVQVSVPDAWGIDIEFTCMLGPSANLMLSAIEHETTINVISPQGSAPEQLISEAFWSTRESDIHASNLSNTLA